MDEKVTLVRDHHRQYGLNRCCEALALSKGTWHYQKHKDGRVDEEEATLREELRLAILEHPGYGYRRLKPEIEARTRKVINHKRLRRLLRETNLGFARHLPRHRPNKVQEILKDNPKSVDLVNGRSWDVLEVLSTDFTQLSYAGGTRKAWFMAMVDIEGKWAPGWAVGPRRNRELAARCWRRTYQAFAEFSLGVDGLIVHQDQDSVYTSYDWLQTLLLDHGVRVSYSETGARENPWVESMWGRIKTEIGSLITEAKDLGELEEIMERHMNYYNNQRRHSSIDNQAPIRHLKRTLNEEDIAAS